jgi:hypothetical protein
MEHSAIPAAQAPDVLRTNSGSIRSTGSTAHLKEIHPPGCRGPLQFLNLESQVPDQKLTNDRNSQISCVRVKDSLMFLFGSMLRAGGTIRRLIAG